MEDFLIRVWDDSGATGVLLIVLFFAIYAILKLTSKDEKQVEVNQAETKNDAKLLDLYARQIDQNDKMVSQNERITIAVENTAKISNNLAILTEQLVKSDRDHNLKLDSIDEHLTQFNTDIHTVLAEITRLSEKRIANKIDGIRTVVDLLFVHLLAVREILGNEDLDPNIEKGIEYMPVIALEDT